MEPGSGTKVCDGGETVQSLQCMSRKRSASRKRFALDVPGRRDFFEPTKHGGTTLSIVEESVHASDIDSGVCTVFF